MVLENGASEGHKDSRESGRNQGEQGRGNKQIAYCASFHFKYTARMQGQTLLGHTHALTPVPKDR